MVPDDRRRLARRQPRRSPSTRCAAPGSSPRAPCSARRGRSSAAPAARGAVPARSRKVEVSLDGGDRGRPAELERRADDGLDPVVRSAGPVPRPGDHALLARATDVAGPHAARGRAASTTPGLLLRRRGPPPGRGGVGGSAAGVPRVALGVALVGRHVVVRLDLGPTVEGRLLPAVRRHRSVRRRPRRRCRSGPRRR